jgi:hypothetical protein
MASRIYVVGSHSGIRLVDAATKQQAVAHVANSTINAHVASQKDLVELLARGVTVEGVKAPEQIDLPGLE